MGPKTNNTASILNQIYKKTRLEKECYLIRQDDNAMFNKIIFFKYKTRQIKTAETNKKISYLN